MLIGAALLPFASANHDTTSPVLNTTTDVGYPTISAALAAASQGDTIVVRPGTYPEQVSITTPSITLCSTDAAGFDCTDNSAGVIIQGASLYPVWIGAYDVTFRGFTVDNSLYTTVDQDFGPIDPSLVVVYGADDVRITNNVLRNPTAPHGPGESVWLTMAVNVLGGSERTIIQRNDIHGLTSSRGPDGTCANDPCRTMAISFEEVAMGWGGGHYVKDNTISLPTGSLGGPAESVGVYGITANLEMTDNVIQLDTGASPGGYYGVFGIFRTSSFVGNDFLGAQHGIFLRTLIDPSHNVIRENLFQGNNEGIRNYATNTVIEDNEFRANNIGVRLAGNPAVTGSSEGVVFKENVLIGNNRALSIHAEVSNLAVDATYNNWGAYTRSGVEDSVEDLGTGNSVDTTCWYDVDGTTAICPPTAAFVFSPATAKRDVEIQFTSTSTSSRPITTFAWDFGDGTTSDEEAPTHEYATSGVKTVSLTVTDTEGYTDTETVLLPIVNNAPVLDAIPARTVAEGVLLQVWTKATDADADSLTYAVAGRPTGATVGTYPNGSALFTWRPTNSQAGAYTVTFTVSDGELTDVESLSITVTDVNRAPLVSIAGPTQVKAGSSATWTPIASDPDGDTITFAWSATDGASGTGTSFAHAFAAGSWVITMTATDARGATATATRAVVADGLAPTTTATADVTETAPGWYAGPVAFTLAATDAGVGVQRISVSIDGGAVRTYSGPVVFDTDGAHTLRYFATDRVGNVEASTTISFGIDTTAADLAIESVDGADPMPVDVVTGGGTISDGIFDIVGSTDDNGGSGVATVVLIVDGVVRDTHSGEGDFVLEWNHFGAALGFHNVVVRATDLVGNVSEESFVVFKGNPFFG